MGALSKAKELNGRLSITGCSLNNLPKLVATNLPNPRISYPCFRISYKGET
jgi:hypothetical protein